MLTHEDTDVNNATNNQTNNVNPQSETSCDNSIDDDGDGYVDCEDQDCFEDANCQDTMEHQCDDKVDNDGDGYTDCDDQDCAGTEQCPNDVEICDNGADDNQNGLIDCRDPLCLEDPSCPTQPPCDPYENSGCNFNENCYADQVDNSLVIFCSSDLGDAVAGELCSGSSDCEPGLACVDGISGSYCTEVCKAGEPTSCPIYKSCSIDHGVFGVCII